MSGVSVKLEGKLHAPQSWADEAEGFVHILEVHPVGAAVLIVCLLVVLVLIPGGVGPSWVKYRGSVRRQDQNRVQDVEKIANGMSKRARRRARGKAKERGEP